MEQPDDAEPIWVRPARIALLATGVAALGLGIPSVLYAIQVDLRVAVLHAAVLLASWVAWDLVAWSRPRDPAVWALVGWLAVSQVAAPLQGPAGPALRLPVALASGVFGAAFLGCVAVLAAFPRPADRRWSAAVVGLAAGLVALGTLPGVAAVLRGWVAVALDVVMLGLAAGVAARNHRDAPPGLRDRTRWISLALLGVVACRMGELVLGPGLASLATAALQVAVPVSVIAALARPGPWGPPIRPRQVVAYLPLLLALFVGVFLLHAVVPDVPAGGLPMRRAAALTGLVAAGLPAIRTFVQRQVASGAWAAIFSGRG